MAKTAGSTTSIKIPKIGNWNVLSSWGIRQLELADHYYYYSQVPEGWGTKPGHSAFHDYLVDVRGLRRAVFIRPKPFSADEADHFNVFDERFIVMKDYRPEYAQAYKVKDVGLDRIVRRFEGGNYAQSLHDPSMLGLVMGNRFYFAPVGKFSDSRFTKEADHRAVQLLSEDEFYKIHHQTPQHPVLGASAFLAQQEAIAFCRQINSAPDAWSDRYDYPDLMPSPNE